MPNPADLASLGDDPYGREPVEGIIAQAPATAHDLLLVTVPSFDADDDPQGTRMRWSGPRGDDLPNPGDRCLVVYTRDGTAWSPVWWPS